MLKEKNTIVSWISKRRDLSNLKLEIIPITNIKKWNCNSKELIHEKNYYFSIIGVEVNHKQDIKKKLGPTYNFTERDRNTWIHYQG